ncbi:hypothetical protein [Streptomyces mirabilis]|uniref:hypothetical protein n=1 Tax=Streptomyces mirabilis TaxID=68239 RepID=UPI00333474AF
MYRTPTEWWSAEMDFHLDQVTELAAEFGVAAAATAEVAAIPASVAQETAMRMRTFVIVSNSVVLGPGQRVLVCRPLLLRRWRPRP